MQMVPTPPFELEKLLGRGLCWACKNVLSSFRNILRIRSADDMSVTVCIMSRTKISSMVVILSGSPIVVFDI